MVLKNAAIYLALTLMPSAHSNVKQNYIKYTVLATFILFHFISDVWTFGTSEIK